MLVPALCLAVVPFWENRAWWVLTLTVGKPQTPLFGVHFSKQAFCIGLSVHPNIWHHPTLCLDDVGREGRSLGEHLQRLLTYWKLSAPKSSSL